jgi:hypothetical protein
VLGAVWRWFEVAGGAGETDMVGMAEGGHTLEPVVDESRPLRTMKSEDYADISVED